jgi:hypothetical protein
MINSSVNRCTLHASVALMLLTTSLLAIPQNFNQGGFFNLAGVSFETFATDQATWVNGATLPGKWSASDRAGTQQLENDAVVFGLPAAAITAQHKDGRVTKLRVSFRETERKSGPLFERLSNNIRAFTGDAGRDLGKQTRLFRHSSVQIVARQISPAQVVLEFTPLA